jgi:glycyl-tRNA synthetase alpha chain
MHSFQNIIMTLQSFWAEKGCALVQPYDLEMGAGTSHPFTALYTLGPRPWRAAFVQTCRRPGDGRYGENPNRLQKFYQFQVIIKPSPAQIQEWLLESYAALGLNLSDHDIRFVEDDWENPSLGASGLGWEVWLDGMEITQFTYFQQMGGIECEMVSSELAYGLERIALCLQKKENIFELEWTPQQGETPAVTYDQLSLLGEQQFCTWYFEEAPIEGVKRHFEDALSWGKSLIEKKLTLPAYDHCVKANHLFNMLDARGAVSVSQRAETIARIRKLASECCHQWMEYYA